MNGPKWEIDSEVWYSHGLLHDTAVIACPVNPDTGTEHSLSSEHRVPRYYQWSTNQNQLVGWKLTVKFTRISGSYSEVHTQIVPYRHNVMDEVYKIMVLKCLQGPTCASTAPVLHSGVS